MGKTQVFAGCVRVRGSGHADAFASQSMFLWLWVSVGYLLLSISNLSGPLIAG